MYENYKASQWADKLVDSYMVQGASRKYATPFAIALAMAGDGSLFGKVTGAHLARFHRFRVPIDYAIIAIDRGVDPETVLQFWAEGIPLEYVAPGA